MTGSWMRIPCVLEKPLEVCFGMGSRKLICCVQARVLGISQVMWFCSPWREPCGSQLEGQAPYSLTQNCQEDAYKMFCVELNLSCAISGCCLNRCIYAKVAGRQDFLIGNKPREVFVCFLPIVTVITRRIFQVAVQGSDATVITDLIQEIIFPRHWPFMACRSLGRAKP